jgi:SAM-dependent methyltransferase
MNPPFYRSTLFTHGATARGAGWGSEYTQRARLDTLLGYIGAGSILDVGCGYGALPELIPDRREDYLGIDACPEMVREARRLHAGWSFWWVDLLDVEVDNGAGRGLAVSDYVVASGLFAFADDAYLEACVKKMWRLTSKTLAFNVLRAGAESEYVPREDVLAGLIADTLPTRSEVVLGYLPNDATVVMWREGC